MNKKNMIKLAVSTASVCLLASSVQATENKPKRQLKNNMMIQTNLSPKSVDSITEMFTEGILYGRLRSNTFKWDWKNDDVAATGNKDNKAFGLGGSLIYKTASLSGVSAMAGLYYTTSPFSGLRMDDADVGKVKAGKDTYSRYQVANGGAWSYAVLAEAALQYKMADTTFLAGRQIFESFLTKSNDTKMIPNTFEGYTLTTKAVPNTRIRGAYFTDQKLRDHTTFHDVITYGTSVDANSSASTNFRNWDGNDDSGVHKGLSYKNLAPVGKTNNALIIADIRNTSLENLQVDVTYGSVPGLFSSLTGEVNYKIAMGGFSLTPGVRYMKQMDNGGGAIGGAGLSGTINATNASAMGYTDGDSLDTSLAMARLVLKKGPLKLQVGYSAVADEADIVTPWRGFPTGGYTRAMAQYNWRANTKTSAAEIYYDFDKAGMISGFNALARYAMQNFDEAKQAGGVQADSNILHVDLRKNFAKTLYAIVRIGLVDADTRLNGTEKDSYNEYRFELNYLF